MKWQTSIVCCLFASGCTGMVLAADAPAGDQPAAPSLSDVLTASGITATGYVAASYDHSNGYPGNLHQFDVKHDTFQLDQAGLTIAYQPKEGFGALVDVIGGEDARILHSVEDGSDNSIDVKQGFVQYATGPLTIMAGKFATLAGFEVINPTGNTNFSRSILFFDSQPLTHTGVRATYAISDLFTVTAGVNNGWNITSTSYGSKTGELSVGFIPNKTFSILATAYAGRVEAYDGDRYLLDLVATLNATAQLSLVLNADFNRQKNAFGDGTDAKWGGVAGYVNFAFSDHWRLSVRGEYFRDKDGFTTGFDQHVWEGTVTLGYMPARSFELRLEGRYDKAQEDSFARHGDPFAVGTLLDSKSLTGFAAQGIYKF